MGDKTGIEWTDATWNPIRGCSRVSEGCRHCYAETVAGRFAGEGLPYEGLVRINPNGKAGGWNGTIKFVESALLQPLRWKTPRKIFVNSMSDLFHEGVTDEMLDRIFAVMALCPQHTFQVLTKRPERMLAYLSASSSRKDVTVAGECTFDECELSDARMPYAADNLLLWPLPNVWLGVSVEDQKAADARIPLLLQTPAAVRFISAEPLLGTVNLDHAVVEEQEYENGVEKWHRTALEAGDTWWTDDGQISDGPEYPALDWVIVGGESGAGARPMDPEWARGLRDQCVAAGVPLFFKQWGEWLPFDQRQAGQISDSASYDLAFPGSAGTMHVGKKATAVAADLMADRSDGWWRVGKKAAGNVLDGVVWQQMPGEVRG